MNSILAATLGGGVGGLVGSLIGGLIGRALPEKWRRGVTTAFVVALALIGSRIAVAQFEANELSPASIEASMLADPGAGPMAQAWRDADPASFRQYTAELGAAARAGASREELVNQARATLQAEAIPRLLRLNDEQILEVALISRDQFRQLRQTQPVICKPFFLGEPFGDITPYVSAESVERERALLVAAFGANLNTIRQTATGDVFAATLTNVLNNTRARVGDDVLLLTGETSANGRDAQFCEAAAVFFEEILALPQIEGAAFVRGLRSGA